MVEKLKENKKLIYIGIGAIIITIIIIVLVIVLTSSGSSDDTSYTPSPEPESTPVSDDTATDTDADISDTGAATIVWWGAFLSEDDVMPLIEEYKSQNPNVTIEYTNQVVSHSEISSYQTKVSDVLADSSSSNAPDLIMIDNGWSGLFQPNLAAAPENVISASDLRSDFYSFIDTDFIYDDEVYGLPLWVDTFAFIYNKEMYEDANLVSPEADWQGFVDDQVPELTQSTNNAITVGGFAAAEPSNTEFWFEALNMLMLQNKVEMLDSQGQAIFGDDADAQDALDFYLQFSGSNQSWSDDFNVDIAAFLEGKLATYMAPTWRLSDIVKYNELGSLGLDIGISAVPQLSDSAGAKANFASYWANVVNANSIYSEETWEFLNFLTQSEQLATLNRTMLNNSSTEIGILFPRIDMASQQSNDQYLGVYVDSLADARSWQMKDKTEIKSEFQTIFDDNATLSEVEEEVNKIL